MSVKNLLRSAFPGLYQWARFKWGNPAIHKCAARILVAKHGRKVLSGPFRGMELSDTVTGSFIPKLIGSYELEIASCIEQIISLRPSQIVDVGCGEGYYLVGLGTRIADCQLIGYDISVEARTACLTQARLNAVRVEVRGECTCEELQSVLTPVSVLILDCEGFEETLLNCVNVPSLMHSSILVELHELFAPGVTDQICKCFANTHEITLFTSQTRRYADFPPLRVLSPKVASLVVDESRYDTMQWAWIQPRLEMPQTSSGNSL